MIYLDVTGGCLLPLRSGIPRTTRGVWQVLNGSGGEVTPVRWQPFRNRYTQLSKRASELLRDAPCVERRGTAARDSTGPLLWASFCDLPAWPTRVDLHRKMRAGDVLLLTSLFPDNRLGYLRRLAELPGRKVAIFHDGIPLRDVHVKGWERARHLEMLRLISKMDLVIAVSRAAQADLLSLWVQEGMAGGPTVALPWPVPFLGLRPTGGVRLGTVRRVLYVSRLKAVKNHATLFAACEKLWSEGISFELELIGCEDEARETRAIRRQMEELQRRGRAISWRAQVLEEELHRAYAEARFTVFPSLMEGFGLPVIESLWHGRPVICSGEGAVGESATGGGCRTVDVRDAAAVAGAMRELLENEGTYRQLVEEAEARKFRSWDDYGRELMALLLPR